MRILQLLKMCASLTVSQLTDALHMESDGSPTTPRYT